MSYKTLESITEIKVKKASPYVASLPSQLLGKAEEMGPKIKACQDYSDMKSRPS